MFLCLNFLLSCVLSLGFKPIVYDDFRNTNFSTETSESLNCSESKVRDNYFYDSNAKYFNVVSELGNSFMERLCDYTYSLDHDIYRLFNYHIGMPSEWDDTSFYFDMDLQPVTQVFHYYTALYDINLDTGMDLNFTGLLPFNFIGVGVYTNAIPDIMATYDILLLYRTGFDDTTYDVRGELRYHLIDGEGDFSGNFVFWFDLEHSWYQDVNDNHVDITDKLYIAMRDYSYLYQCYSYDYGGRNGDYAQAYQDGADYGYINGYNQATTDIFDNEDNEIHQTIFDNGYYEGHQVGYAEGVDYAYHQDTTALTIFTGIIDVGLLPVNVFLKVFEFEVFGINIAGAVSALLTIAVAFIILRFITGKKND